MARTCGIWCFVSLVAAVTVAATTAPSMSIFASHDIVVPADRDVTRIEVSGYRLGRQFTEASLITRILAVLRSEKAGWKPYAFTQPNSNSYLRIFDAKGLSLAFDFNLGRCRNGLYLYSGQRERNRDTVTVTKQFGSERCAMLMTALEVPEKFWKQP